jgi:predicted Zn-dependent protease
MKFFVILLLFITAGYITAQGNITDALSRMDTSISEAEEVFTMRDSYFLGRTVAAHILTRYRSFTANPALSEYLNLICSALAINSPSPNWYNGYRVMILDTDVPNAFSTPGGHIFITRGIINLATSEDMLAAIIAHEMAHIQLEHAVADIKQTRVTQRLGQEQQRLSQGLSGQQQEFTQSVNQIVNSLLGRGYSQLQEFEADNAAVTLLALAGYNPESLIELIRIMGRLQGSQMASLNNSHPLPSQRIANLERRPVPRVANTTSARVARFNRIMAR